jgi:uncharacterized protein (DUF4415 family)
MLGSNATSLGHPAQGQLEEEDYAVYSALINTAVRPRTEKETVLIRQKTSTRLGFQLVETDQLDPELIQDFQMKNGTPYRLENKFSLAKYRIIGEAEESEIFQGTGPIITLSRIGFNSTRDQAFVLITLRMHPTNTKEYHVLLTRQDKNWSVAKKLSVINILNIIDVQIDFDILHTLKHQGGG